MLASLGGLPPAGDRVRVGATEEYSALGDSLLVTKTYTWPDATDLGHLLRKHPATVQTIEASVWQVHVFYPGVRKLMLPPWTNM
ncbi:hypothetical protein [Arthrobacter alpinus]|uniref:hypothetical protein n=1 Tax=Arthrobacter alpinus TaxID=656366 RepID=UPI0037C0B2ED